MDTQDKRASAIFPIFVASRLYPNPDGDIANAADRTHMAWLYRGVAVSASAAGGTSRFRMLMGVGL